RSIYEVAARISLFIVGSIVSSLQLSLRHPGTIALLHNILNVTCKVCFFMKDLLPLGSSWTLKLQETLDIILEVGLLGAKPI
ncbi:hypothetical protein CR513_39284, partial [Mucuna pruriens]